MAGGIPGVDDVPTSSQSYRVLFNSAGYDFRVASGTWAPAAPESAERRAQAAAAASWSLDEATAAVRAALEAVATSPQAAGRAVVEEMPEWPGEPVWRLRATHARGAALEVHLEHEEQLKLLVGDYGTIVEVFSGPDELLRAAREARPPSWRVGTASPSV